MSEQEKFFVVVGEKEYNLIKKGRGQAEQLVAVTSWLSDFGMPVYDKLTGSDVAEFNNIQVILVILETLSPDALIALFSAVIGCSKKEAEKEFDFGILVEAIEIIWNHQPAIKRVVNRFFSTTTSEEDSEEPSTK